MSLQRDCCLCGEVKAQVKFLFSDESLQFGTVMKINQLFNQILSISNYSSCSKFICSDCELSIHHFYKFFDMVQTAQKNLSFVHHNETSQNSSIFGRQQIDDKPENRLNLCHTTGITTNSKPVLIKISLVKRIQCGVCETSLCTSQLSALHQVTHGLGTVLCRCEQCGHQDDIASFLPDKHTVHCPQCSLRKLHSVDVQTQFQSSEETGEEKLMKSTNKLVDSPLQSSVPLVSSTVGGIEFHGSFPTPHHSAANNPNLTGNLSLNNSNSVRKLPDDLNSSKSGQFSGPSSVSNSDDEFSSSELDFCASQNENYAANFYPPPSIFSSGKFTSRTTIDMSTADKFSSPSHVINSNSGNFPPTVNMSQFSSQSIDSSHFSPLEHDSSSIFEDNKCNNLETSLPYSRQHEPCDESTMSYHSQNNTCDEKSMSFLTQNNNICDEKSMSYSTQNNTCDEKSMSYSTQNNTCDEKSMSYSTQNNTCDEKSMSYSTQNNTCDEKSLPVHNSSLNFPEEKKARSRRERLHPCEVCSRVFNHRGHLKRHMLVHDKSIKPFLCEECGMRFNQKSSLVTHWTSIHCKDGPNTRFSCVICGQIYKHKMNLLAHLLNNHNHTNTTHNHTTHQHTNTLHNQNTPQSITPHNLNQSTPESNNSSHTQNKTQNSNLNKSENLNTLHNNETHKAHQNNNISHNTNNNISQKHSNDTQKTPQNSNIAHNNHPHSSKSHKDLNTPQLRLTTKFYCPPCDKYFISSSRLNAHSKVHKQRKVS